MKRTVAARATLHRLLPTVAAALVWASCTSGSSDAAPTTRAPSTTTTAATVPEPTTTTAPPATTSTTAAPVWTEEEQAIIDAYEQFQVELVAVLVDSERDLTRLRSLASEPVGEAIEASIARRRLEGIGTDGTLHIEVLGIRFFGLDLAEIDVCSWDTTVRVEEGMVVSEPDPTPLTRTAEMEKSNGRWVVGDAKDNAASGLECVLD